SSNDLLGSRPDVNLILRMQEVLDSFELPIGYHDLIIHKYGPNKVFATVDIEIDSRLSLIKAHKVIDEIEQEFEKQFNIKLVGHLDPIILRSEEHTSELQSRFDLVCRLLLEKKKNILITRNNSVT